MASKNAILELQFISKGVEQLNKIAETLKNFSKTKRTTTEVVITPTVRSGQAEKATRRIGTATKKIGDHVEANVQKLKKEEAAVKAVEAARNRAAERSRLQLRDRNLLRRTAALQAAGVRTPQLLARDPALAQAGLATAGGYAQRKELQSLTKHLGNLSRVAAMQGGILPPIGRGAASLVGAAQGLEDPVNQRLLQSSLTRALGGKLPTGFAAATTFTPKMLADAGKVLSTELSQTKRTIKAGERKILRTPGVLAGGGFGGLQPLFEPGGAVSRGMQRLGTFFKNLGRAPTARRGVAAAGAAPAPGAAVAYAAALAARGARGPLAGLPIIGPEGQRAPPEWAAGLAEQRRLRAQGQIPFGPAFGAGPAILGTQGSALGRLGGRFRGAVKSVIGAQDIPLLGKVFPGDDKRFRGFGTAVRTVGQFAGASAIMFAFANSIRDAVSSAVELEDIMLRIQAVLPTRSELERVQINQAIVKAAREYSVDLLQAAASAKIFAQQGLSAAKIAEQLSASMLAVQGVGLTAEQAREMLTAVRNITNEQKSSMEILDTISRIESRRAVDAASLSDALKQAGPLAQQLEGDFIGLVDALDIVLGATTAIVEETRVSGRQAATSLRFILARLGRPQIVKQLEDIGGVQLATAESGGRQLRPLLEILEELSRAYAKLRSTKGTAEATKFLVALAGARQVNPASVLLTNFATVLQTARIGALAFGDAQERADIILGSFKARLQATKTEMRIFGDQLINNSDAGLVLKSAVDGLGWSFQTITTNIDSGILQVAALTVAYVGLFKIVSALTGAFRAFAVAGGAAAVAGTSPFAVGAAGALAAVPKAGILQRGAIKAVGGFGIRGAGALGAGAAGLGTLLPGAVVGGLALAGLAFGIVKVIKLLKDVQKEAPLAAKTLSFDDVDVTQAPALGRFRDRAKDFKTTSNELIETIGVAATTILPKLQAFLEPNEKITDNVLRLRDSFGITRKALIDEFIDIVGEKLPGFQDHMEELVDGFDPLQAAVLETTEVLSLLGDASFVAVAFLGGNLERASAAAEGLGNQILTALTLVEKTAPKRLDRIFEDTSMLSDMLRNEMTSSQFQTTVKDLQKAVSKVFSVEGQPEGVPELMGQLFTLDQATVQEALQFAATKGAGIGTFMQAYGTLLETDMKGAGGEAFTRRMATALADRYETVLATSAEKMDVGGLSFLEEEGPFGALARALPALFAETGVVLRENLAKGVGIPVDAIEAFENTLARIGAGTEIEAMMSRAFIAVKDPLDQLMLSFFVASKRIDDNVEAAHRLGLEYNTLSVQLRNLEAFGKKFFQAETDLVDKILKDVIKLRNTEIVARTVQEQAAQDMLATLEQGGRMSELLREDLAGLSPQQKIEILLNTKSKDEILKLQVEIAVLAKKLADLGTEEENLLAVFGGIRGQEQLKELQQFFADFTDQAVAFNDEMTKEEVKIAFAKLVITLFQMTDSFERQIGLVRELTVELKLQQDQSKKLLEIEQSRVDAIADVSKARIESATNIANLELPTALRLRTELDKIRQIHEVTITTERQKAALQLAELSRQRQLKLAAGEAFSEEKFLTQQNAIILGLTAAEKQAEITAAREASVLRIANLEEQIAEQFNQQVTNSQARLEGVKKLLTDYQALISGKGLAEALSAAGGSFVDRQVDALFEGLFNPKVGLLKGISNAIGAAGETFSPIASSHVEGAILASPIITQAIIDGFLLAKSLLVPGVGVPSVGQGLLPFPDIARDVLLPGGLGLGPTLFRRQQMPTFPGADDVDAEFSARQRQQIINAAATAAGSLGGAAAGGGGRGAQIGGQFGTLGGALLGARLGAVGGPLAIAAGGIIGGVIGGLFDKEEEQTVQMQIIARNTGRQVDLLENTNQLLDPSNISFNLPSGFTLPSFAPSAFGGGTGATVITSGGASSAVLSSNITITVHASGSDASAIGQEIADTVATQLSEQINSSGLYVSRV